MSKLLKKIGKAIKKTFKRIVKVVKKIVKSKLFKAIVIAGAIVVGGTALMGGLGALGGATSAATVGSTAGITGAAGASAIQAGTNLAAQGLFTGAASTGAFAAGGSVMTGAAAGSSLLGGAATWAASNPLLASTALNMGGSVLSGIAADKAAKEEKKKYDKEMKRNNSTKLNILEDTRGILERTGYYSKSQQGTTTDEGGNTVYNSPIKQASVTNVEAKPSQYYNSADNNWKAVS